MTFHRLRDLEYVHNCFTHPSIYATITDDFAPEPHNFKVNDHPDIWYLGINSRTEFIGIFSLIPDSEICWQLHVATLPWTRSVDRWAAARELIPWLAEHTDCKRLTASVPACNEKAIVYGTHGLGMHIVGRHPKAFLKDGELQDLVLMGRAIGG